MKLVWAVLQPRKLLEVVDALQAVPGLGGVTVTEVRGFGRQRGSGNLGETPAVGALHFVPKVRIDVVVDDPWVEPVLRAIERHARTGQLGDGKVFILPVEDVLRIRTGERGSEAI